MGPIGSVKFSPYVYTSTFLLLITKLKAFVCGSRIYSMIQRTQMISRPRATIEGRRYWQPFRRKKEESEIYISLGGKYVQLDPFNLEKKRANVQKKRGKVRKTCAWRKRSKVRHWWDRIKYGGVLISGFNMFVLWERV